MEEEIVETLIARELATDRIECSSPVDGGGGGSIVESRGETGRGRRKGDGPKNTTHRRVFETLRRWRMVPSKTAVDLDYGSPGNPPSGGGNEDGSGNPTRWSRIRPSRKAGPLRSRRPTSSARSSPASSPSPRYSSSSSCCPCSPCSRLSNQTNVIINPRHIRDLVVNIEGESRGGSLKLVAPTPRNYLFPRTVDVVVGLMVSVAGLRVGGRLGVLHGESVVQAVLQRFVLRVVGRRRLALLAVPGDEARPYPGT